MLAKTIFLSKTFICSELIWLIFPVTFKFPNTFKFSWISALLFTFSVPSIIVLPLVEATVNLSVATSKSPSNPVAPETSNVPAIVVLPLDEATVNLFVATSKSPSTPVAPATSNAVSYTHLRAHET